MTTNLLSAILTKFYSNASNARRAARNAGVQFTTVTQGADGWQIVLPTWAANTTGDQLGGTVPADMPVIAVPAPVARVAKSDTPDHKTFARYEHSGIAKPVAYVHAYLAAHPDLSRKDALHQLCANGINYHTARTQYQVWFRGR